MRNTTAVLSMLHEGPLRHSASRLFRCEPVLAWTLRRLSGAARLGGMAILCWADQLGHVRPLAEARGVHVLAKDPRVPMPALEAVAAAQRWADGWRGGLLGTCDFDLGFHGPWVHEIAERLQSDAVLLVDPSSGLVDPCLLDAMVAHGAERASVDLCFCQAAPGLSGVLLKRRLVDQLATAQVPPGRFLTYLPDQPGRDPVSFETCVPVPTTVARTIHRFKLDSDRQIQRLHEATASLNGELVRTGAEELVHRLNARPCHDPMPREVTLELGTTRATRPIFASCRHLDIRRPDLLLPHAERLFGQLGAVDDVRLTLAGVGDPLLATNVFEVIEAASKAGITAIHLETDLLQTDEPQLARLAAAPLDVVSVHLPAISGETYERVMGTAGLDRVLANLRLLLEHRNKQRRSLPLLVPVFTKCAVNLAEMEPWYDHWLRALGSAVIAGPGDYAGQIPDSAVADMAPPQRRPCGRLANRMCILSNGTAVACEQDVLAVQPLGNAGSEPLRDLWQQQTGTLCAAHRNGEWAAYPLCAACREWHRP